VWSECQMSQIWFVGIWWRRLANADRYGEARGQTLIRKRRRRGWPFKSWTVIS